MVMDFLASKFSVNIDRLKFKSLCCDCKINGRRVLLMKPQTYMNNSGQAIVEAMSFYKIPPERVIIIFDDISLDLGRLRIRLKGSDGGQNGMKNIIYLSGSDMFPRIKIGIGAKPNPEWELSSWVLSKLTQKELETLHLAAKNACDAIGLMLGGEDAKAMNLYNS